MLLLIFKINKIYKELQKDYYNILDNFNKKLTQSKIDKSD